MPQPGPDELLVRHDAVGLCFSDIKVIKQGQAHTRIFKDMKTDPVVLGHEVSMTIVQVGENLRDQYQVGQRFIIQADIYKDGVNYAYGYMIQGGLSEYALIDQRVLNGDDGNYLLPVQDETGYAESALTEPWACVIAAYELSLPHRAQGGRHDLDHWHGRRPSADYQISAGMDAAAHPARVILTDVPASLAAWVKEQAAKLGFEVIERNGLQPDDYASICELAPDGDGRHCRARRRRRRGRGRQPAAGDARHPLHHGRRAAGRARSTSTWVASTIIAGPMSAARAATSPPPTATHPVRSSLKPGGKALFVGAGGPMGRMHVQRAIQLENGPSIVACTDISDARLQDMRDTFGA